MAAVLTIPGKKVWIEVQRGGMYTFLSEAPTGNLLNVVAGEGGMAYPDPVFATYLKNGESVTVAAQPYAGYRFEKWTTSSSGSFADANSSTTTFTMPGNETTVTAHFVLTDA